MSVPFEHEADLVAALGLVEVVRGHEERRAALAQVVEEVPQALALARVDARGRLVEEDELRVVHERAREREALLHAAGQRARLHVLQVEQLDVAEQLVHARVGAGAGDAVDAGEEAEVLLDGEIRVERERLRHVAGLALDALALRADVAAGDDGTAAGRLKEPAQHLDRRRLAGAVRAEKAEDLAARDAQRERVDRAVRAEAACEPVRRDDQVGVTAPASSGTGGVFSSGRRRALPSRPSWPGAPGGRPVRAPLHF